ncbi:MAG: hypothetical protein ACOYXU_00125 [Nitrospirota bacterium]
MSTPAPLSGELRALVSDSLERERQLARVYRVHMQAASSARLRRLWDEGWTLKRAHDDVLTPVLAAGGPSADSAHAAPSSPPSPREALSWAYDQERRLELQYQDAVRLAQDEQTHRLLARLEEGQRGWIDRVRATYRDYSTS